MAYSSRADVGQPWCFSARAGPYGIGEGATGSNPQAPAMNKQQQQQQQLTAGVGQECGKPTGSFGDFPVDLFCIEVTTDDGAATLRGSGEKLKKVFVGGGSGDGRAVDGLQGGWVVWRP